jgi:hypothetical protein
VSRGEAFDSERAREAGLRSAQARRLKREQAELEPAESADSELDVSLDSLIVRSIAQLQAGERVPPGQLAGLLGTLLRLREEERERRRKTEFVSADVGAVDGDLVATLEDDRLPPARILELAYELLPTYEAFPVRLRALIARLEDDGGTIADR